MELIAHSALDVMCRCTIKSWLIDSLKKAPLITEKLNMTGINT